MNSIVSVFLASVRFTAAAVTSGVNTNAIVPFPFVTFDAKVKKLVKEGTDGLFVLEVREMDLEKKACAFPVVESRMRVPEESTTPFCKNERELLSILPVEKLKICCPFTSSPWKLERKRRERKRKGEKEIYWKLCILEAIAREKARPKREISTKRW